MGAFRNAAPKCGRSPLLAAVRTSQIDGGKPYREPYSYHWWQLCPGILGSILGTGFASAIEAERRIHLHGDGDNTDEPIGPERDPRIVSLHSFLGAGLREAVNGAANAKLHLPFKNSRRRSVSQTLFSPSTKVTPFWRQVERRAFDDLPIYQHHTREQPAAGRSNVTSAPRAVIKEAYLKATTPATLR